MPYQHALVFKRQRNGDRNLERTLAEPPEQFVRRAALRTNGCDKHICIENDSAHRLHGTADTTTSTSLAAHGVQSQVHRPADEIIFRAWIVPPRPFVNIA